MLHENRTSGNYLLTAYLLLMLFSSCQDEFLDKKMATNLNQPSTLDDFEQLLNNTDVMGEAPSLGEIATTDYYVSHAIWEGLPEVERNAYIWNKTIYNGTENIADWNVPYEQIFYANVALDGLKEIPANKNPDDWSRIKGRALFIRAFAYYNLSQVFCPPYEENASRNPYGMPLRLESDIDKPSKRSTVGETYERILSDLKEAAKLLPEAVPEVKKNLPSRPAALALLARVYLSMRDYENAGKYADSSLKIYSRLMDYNTMDLSPNVPFDISNSEVVYRSRLSDYHVTLYLYYSPEYAVDDSLLEMYEKTDLRKTAFFKTNMTLKGSYTGSTNRFNGLATDELYLIRAECSARNGLVGPAMEDLNKLRKHRYDIASYSDLSAATAEEALRLVLKERRKELIFRGLRWSDLRRLNQEGAGITLVRQLNGQAYVLPPGDPKWTFPIPDEVVSLSGIIQNPR